ncbi:MAG TPA: fused MFS/spermidine synthase [Usitatibacter sp.]|nr:fused MFS/spermidine synthase [Usitatibacter sp.]
MTTAARRSTDTVLVLFFVSGFCGLIYESVWAHYVKLMLGHAAYAQTLVLAVFIGGLALGSWLCARVAERIRNPLLGYAIIEGAIGLFALVFHNLFMRAMDWGFESLLPGACEQATTFCGPQWALAAAMLAPQSILLGMTFPLVSSAVLRLDNSNPGHDISALYFLNSLGAVLGVLASGFLLIPAVGLPGTLMMAGVANVVIAVLAYFVSKGMPGRLDIAKMAAPRAASGEEKPLLVPLLAVAFFTGLSSFIYEVGWIRMLSLVLGSSTYSFELMLASFILGLALGGLWIRKHIDAAADPIRLLALIQVVMGLLAALSIPIYNGSFDLMAWLLSAVSRNEAGFVIFNLTSTLICCLVMLPTTFCAGMTLPLITYRLLRSPTGEKSLGLVYSVNTVGGVIGVVVAVHFLLERFGLDGTLIAGAAIDVILGVALLALVPGRPRRRVAYAAVALVALAFVAMTFHIDPRRSSSGVFRTAGARIGADVKIVFHRDGKTASVDVIETAGRRTIRTNGKPDAGLNMDPNGFPTGDEYTMAMLAILPLGHNPEARNAAVIGFGSGMSTAFLLNSPNLQHVETIEIEPAMVEGARNFMPFVTPAFEDPRSRIVIDDAKSYFARGRNRYDIIVSEPSNPWVSGVASLFTEEFYARLSGYLNEGGILSQWLHTYEMDSATLASILKAIAKTFPDYTVYSTIDADIVIIARKGGAPGAFQGEVLEWPKMREMAQKLKFDRGLIERRMMASWRATEPLFATYFIAANSDFFPVVDHRASKTRFTRARADVLTDLQTSPIPMLEMLDAAKHGDRGRGEAPRATMAEAARQQGWVIRDVVMSGAAGSIDVQMSENAAPAFMVHSWAALCRDDFPFDAVLPHLQSVAQLVNPHIEAAAAAEMWQWIARSNCGKRLTPTQRGWLDLFESIGRRDPRAMVAGGRAVLAADPGTATAATETALLAAAVGLVCQGEPREADALLTQYAPRFFRKNQRETELRYLLGLTQPSFKARAPDGPCTTTSQGARRSP